jgi:hypothetical protein
VDIERFGIGTADEALAHLRTRYATPDGGIHRPRPTGVGHHVFRPVWTQAEAQAARWSWPRADERIFS